MVRCIKLFIDFSIYVKRCRRFTARILFKVNAAAVAIIIISGVLMSIDQTKILSIWTNMQTWTVFLLIKVLVL